ncbi:BTB/POZ protein [Glomus cerebriforme]|uniref:BTB/POZ protein n=1 Tax=Glomus cerebriforme TaxID=658196 RepID=A0A397TEB4_9GLOM|nr:BTB/POZ protein [Glomus cerebriforme]
MSEATYNNKRASGVYTIKDTLKDPITFGIKFQDFKSLKMQSTASFWNQPLPDNLRNAWENQFERPDMSDVRFIVNGKNFFASSTILSKRSSYFTNVFSGQWIETNYHKDITTSKAATLYSTSTDNQFLSKSRIIEDSENYHHPTYKYTVKIPDFHHETFRELLRYFYTNEVVFNIETETTSSHILPSSAFNILLIADKYLVTDLCEIAKTEVLRTLTIENSAMILFGSAGKWPDLKEKVLEFVIKNFNKVRETSGFEYVMDNYSMFSSNFGDIMKEIMKLMKPKTVKEHD